MVMNNNLKNDCKYFENNFVDYINGLLTEKDTSFCFVNMCQK